MQEPFLFLSGGSRLASFYLPPGESICAAYKQLDQVLFVTLTLFALNAAETFSGVYWGENTILARFSTLAKKDLGLEAFQPRGRGGTRERERGREGRISFHPSILSSLP